MNTRSDPSTSALLLAPLALALLAGCSEPADNASDAGPPKCVEGQATTGQACVPAFDDCKEGELPLLGGGCKRIGVTECAGGWGLAGPPNWKCKPIGPPRTCLKGWAKVAGGWCEPILPQAKCPTGTMEVLGQSSCQPLGDCGAGTWGKIKTTSQTIYVDQNHSGTGGSGSKGSPFKTIAAALKVASAEAHIAVAAGTYKENIAIERKITLDGVCAQKVTIQGASSYQVVELSRWAKGAILRGVTITGAGLGVWVNGVDVTLERVAVQGCGDRGVEVTSGGALTLRHSLVADNRTMGLLVTSSRATLERSVVRGTLEHATSKQWGNGIQAALAYGKTTPSQLTLRDSLVSGNRNAGVFLFSSRATMERTVVRDTRPRATDGTSGQGIQAALQDAKAGPSQLTLRDCVVSGNRNIGVFLFSSKATLERTVVRDTMGQASDNTFGIGIHGKIQPGHSTASELTIKDSLVLANRNAGLVLASSKATLERTVVRDTKEQASDKTNGVGLAALVEDNMTRPSKLTVRDCVVAGNRMVGVALVSSQATLERTVVRDTKEQASDGRAGTGIQAGVRPGKDDPSELTLKDCVLANNRNVGVHVVSSTATLERTVVRDTRFQPKDKLGGTGIAVQIEVGQTRPSKLTARHCLVLRSLNAGVSIDRSSAKLEHSAVLDTRLDGLGKYGDGIEVDQKGTLVIEGSLIKGSARAGMLFSASGGAVRRCLIRDNVFAVDLEHGAAPTISTDNLFVNNKVNKVSTGQGLEVPAAPVAPDPLGKGGGSKSPDAGVGTP